MDLIIISGRSGAGKSLVLSALEDQGYYCIDNVPVNLLQSTIKEVASWSEKVAVSLDIRNLFYYRDEQTLNSVLTDLRRAYNTAVLFLDCDSEVIINRYADTRRSHPLMAMQQFTLEQAIEEENNFLYGLRSNADYLLNTSETNVHQLASMVNGVLDLFSNTDPSKFKIIFNSFGFKRIVPPSSNFVFDVRHLPNPYWDKSLASQTGLDQEVIDFFHSHRECQEELQHIINYLDHWLDRVDKTTARRFCVVSIGCTGGQHRSVFIADQLAQYYAQRFSTQSYHFTLQRSKNYF